MASLALAFDVLARDKASRVLGKVGDESDRLHKRTAIAAGAGVALGLGVGALVGGISKVVSSGIGEMADYQTGLAQANTVIKSTGGAAGVTSAHVEDLASSIQGYSGQTDDSIVSGENLLLTFTNIRNEAGKGNDVFDQTTKTLADMSQALGQDSKTSAIQLGKALNDPVRGVTQLQKVGVSFTAGQKKTIKSLVDSGHTMAAQKVILAELNKEFGGSAKAFGDTGPGKIARGKRAFEDFSQSIVTAVAPVVENLGTVVLPLLTRGVAAVGPALDEVKSFIASEVLPVVQRLVAAVARDLVPILTTVVDVFRTDVLPVLRGVADFIATRVAPVIIALAQAALSGLRQALGTVRNAIAENRPQLEALFNGLRKVATVALAVLRPVLTTVLPIAFRILGIAMRIVIVVIADIVRAVQGFAAVTATVIGFVRDHWRLFATVFATLIGGPVIGAIVLIVTHLDTVKRVAGDVVDFVTSRFNTLVGFITGLPGRVGSAAVGLFDGIKEAFRSAINFIVDGWNGLEFSLPSVDTHIPGVGRIGGWTLGTPDIPRLAAGGVVRAATGGTVALLGEAGHDERVQPLDAGGMTSEGRALLAELRKLRSELVPATRAVGGDVGAAISGAASAGHLRSRTRVAGSTS